MVPSLRVMTNKETLGRLCSSIILGKMRQRESDCGLQSDERNGKDQQGLFVI